MNVLNSKPQINLKNHISNKNKGESIRYCPKITVPNTLALSFGGRTATPDEPPRRDFALQRCFHHPASQKTGALIKSARRVTQYNSLLRFLFLFFRTEVYIPSPPQTAKNPPPAFLSDCQRGIFSYAVLVQECSQFIGHKARNERRNDCPPEFVSKHAGGLF